MAAMQGGVSVNFLWTRQSARFLPALALIAVTAVWGSTFFMIKDLVKVVPSLDFLGTRFLFAAVLIVLFQFSRLRSASASLWFKGAVLGALYACAQVLQTIGLESTHASISGFITGMYVVFTPIIYGLLSKTRIDVRTLASAALAFGGVAILGLKGFVFGYGEFLTLLGALVYALHIIVLGRYAQKSQVLTLALIQVLFVGIFLGCASLPDGVVLPSGLSMWLSLLYMALIAGLLALLLQTWAQSKLSPVVAAVIMTIEPLFAAFFAVLCGGETLSIRMVCGGFFVLISMVLIEGKSAPIQENNQRRLKNEEN